MATVLALPKLYEDVSAAMLATTPGVQFSFGWREPSKNVSGVGTARVVFVPGDVQGNLGEYAPARNPGRNPRPIATLRELFMVVLSAADHEKPRDELAQYTAARLLYDEWLRCVYVAAHGTFQIIDQVWNVTKNEHRFGAEIRVTGAIESMIPDAVESEAVDVAARVSETTQGVTVIFNAPAS
jgi:hypothetical protein